MKIKMIFVAVFAVFAFVVTGCTYNSGNVYNGTYDIDTTLNENFLSFPDVDHGVKDSDKITSTDANIDAKGSDDDVVATEEEVDNDVPQDKFNHKPVANPGKEKAAIKGYTVPLDGSLSSDGDGDPLTFMWMFVSVPEGSTAVIEKADQAKASFSPDLKGTYEISLVVNDGKEDSDVRTIKVKVINYQEIEYTTDGAPVDKEYKIFDAEFSKTLDKIVMISQYPTSQIIVYDTTKGTYETIKLPLQPVAVSVSPDGMKAAVAHDSWISIVDLSTVKIDYTYQVNHLMSDVVYGMNDYVYFFAQKNEIGAVYALDLASKETSSWAAGMSFQNLDGSLNEEEEKTTVTSWIIELKAKLHPNGCQIYTTVFGLADPAKAKLRVYDVCGADLAVFTVKDPEGNEQKISLGYMYKDYPRTPGGVPKRGARTHYVDPNYTMDGDIWITEQVKDADKKQVGIRVFTKTRGNAFATDFDPTKKPQIPPAFFPEYPNYKFYTDCGMKVDMLMCMGVTAMSYVGSLQESNDFSVKFLHHSAAVERIVVVTEATNKVKDNEVQIYGDTYLEYLRTIEMPVFSTKLSQDPNNPDSTGFEEFPGHVDFAFLNKDGKKLYIILHGYNESKTINNYGILEIEDYDN